MKVCPFNDAEVLISIDMGGQHNLLSEFWIILGHSLWARWRN